MTSLPRLIAAACLGLCFVPTSVDSQERRRPGNYGLYRHFEGPGYRGWGYYDRLGFDPSRRPYISRNGYRVGCWKWVRSDGEWTKVFICPPQE